MTMMIKMMIKTKMKVEAPVALVVLVLLVVVVVVAVAGGLLFYAQTPGHILTGFKGGNKNSSPGLVHLNILD